MIVFIGEDEAYLHWLDNNQSGFVVNTYRRPSSSYLVLHRATCPHVSTAARTNWTTKQYIKICSGSLRQLQDWAENELGGSLRRCTFCSLKSNRQPLPPIAEPATIKKSTWQFWQPKTPLAEIRDLLPLKASWDKSTHPSQVRLREYRRGIRESLMDAVAHDCLYLDLHVGLPLSADLLSGNDLENYLTPLFECGCLPATQFRLVMAEKSSGGDSRLAVGIAEPGATGDDLNDCCHFSIFPETTPASDRGFKEELFGAIAACGHPTLPDGEVELHVAWRCPLGRRSWFRLWKSTGDALGPILGAYKRKNQFDPKDDRISKLVFQFLPDESMGDRLQIGMWWRMR
jgi:hypothetical protein